MAARAAQRDAGVERVMFVDLDVHQGDGTVSAAPRAWHSECGTKGMAQQVGGMATFHAVHVHQPNFLKDRHWYQQQDSCEMQME